MTVARVLYRLSAIIAAGAVTIAVSLLVPSQFTGEAWGLGQDEMCYTTPMPATPSPCGCPQGTGPTQAYDICSAVMPLPDESEITGTLGCLYYMPDWTCTEDNYLCGDVMKCLGWNCEQEPPTPPPSAACTATDKGQCEHDCDNPPTDECPTTYPGCSSTAPSGGPWWYPF